MATVTPLFRAPVCSRLDTCAWLCVCRLVLNVFVVIMLWGPIGLDLPMDQKKPLVLGISALFLLVSCFSQSRLLAAISSTEKDRKQ